MRRQRSLKASLGWLLAAVFIPLLAAGAAFLTNEWIKERDQAIARLRDNARALRIAVDLELALDQAVLRALAASRDIDTKDWARFHAEARETSAVRPGSWFVLFDRDGQQLVNTSVPVGTALPNVTKLGSASHGEWQGRKIPMPNSSELLAPLQDGKPRYTGLHYGPVVKRPVVGNAVSVLRDGKPRYSLMLAYGAEFFQRLVASPGNSAEMINVIVDGTGLIIARNLMPEKFVGSPGAGAFRNGTMHLPREGVGEAINVEGVEVLYAHSRSTINDWAVWVALPERVVLAPAWRALGLWIAVLAGAALIGAFFAVRLWRRLAIPLHALARQARSLGHSRAPLPATDIEEVEALSRALRQAADNAEALRASKEQLEDVDRRRMEFLSMLSHELRNPLAAISNVSIVLTRGLAQPSGTPALYEVLHRQTRQLARMVDDLLDVARITRGKIRLRKELVRLDVLARQVAADARSTMEAKAHRSTMTATEEVWVEGDEARLKQVLGNLLDNATKYTDPGGEIALEVCRKGDEALICVRDNGSGIDSALLPHVFDLFTQGPRGLHRSEGGLGIGLALVKSLVEMHGGRVDVKSEVGRGTEFTVRLPVASTAPAHSPEPGSRARATGLRILIVEDNADTADSLATLLRAGGNEVQLAYDGVRGLEKARQWRPDAILLDIGLPAMSGHDLCRALRRESWGKNVPIVAVTGWGQADDHRKSKEAGFDDHLVKPVNPEAVMELLAQLRSGQDCVSQD